MYTGTFVRREVHMCYRQFCSMGTIPELSDPDPTKKNFVVNCNLKILCLRK
jgi:hypothetical protein